MARFIFLPTFAKIKRNSMNEIVSIISSVGFPIVMCLILVKYMSQENAKHESEINALRDTLESNTKVLTELCTLIKTLVK